MDKKYTFWEWLFITVIGCSTTLVAVLFMIPIGLIFAWIRVKMWDWFIVPYFHAPHISVWLMFAIGCLLATNHGSSYPPLKEEFYSTGKASRALAPFAGHLLGFFLAYVLHVTVLKG